MNRSLELSARAARRPSLSSCVVLGQDHLDRADDHFPDQVLPQLPTVPLQVGRQAGQGLLKQAGLLHEHTEFKGDFVTNAIKGLCAAPKGQLRNRLLNRKAPSNGRILAATISHRNLTIP